jgi:hypothetical protein
MNSNRLMLKLPAGSLEVIKGLLEERKEALSPVSAQGKARKVNEDYLNVLTLLPATASAAAAQRAAPDRVKDDKPTLYLTAGEFRTLLRLLKRKSQDEAADEKRREVRKELEVAEDQFDHTYGPDFLAED